MAVVFATLDPSQGYRSINEFVVEKGMPGFSVGKKEQKLGIRGSSTVELIFEDCWIPESNLIGERNRGFRQALEAIDGSRITVAAQAVGIAQAAFDAALTYAKERCQFGQPIANSQQLSKCTPGGCSNRPRPAATASQFTLACPLDETLELFEMQGAM